MRGKALKLGAGVLVAALACALAVAVTGCGSQSASSGGTSTAASAEPIKIGAVLSLTGSNAALGTAQKQVFDMEAKAVNDGGGINGRKIEVIIEDDATDPTKAVAAATKLIEQDKVVGLLAASATGPTMAIRSLVDRAGVPQIAMAGGNDVVGKLDKNVFGTAWNNALVAPFELAYMQKHGVKKIGLITDSNAFGKDGKAVLASLVASYGITIASDQTYNAGDADMSAQLTNIKKSGADALVLWGAGAEAATIVKNARSLGLTVPIYGSHGNGRAQFAEGIGAAGDGFLFGAGHILVPSTYGTDTPEFKVATDFVTRFKAANKGAAPSTFAGHGYDAFHIMVNAIKAAGSDVTPAKLRDEIEKTSGFTGIGGVFTYTATDHLGLAEKDLTMYQVKGGKFEVAPQ